MMALLDPYKVSLNHRAINIWVKGHLASRKR